MILGIYGSGGLGCEMSVLAEKVNEVGTRWSQIVFVDDLSTDRVKLDLAVITFEDFQRRNAHDGAEICIAVGEPALRAELAHRVRAARYGLASLVHPRVEIPSSTLVGAGAIICCNCFVSCGVRIGENVLLQPGASVGHDCVIGESSVLSSFVCLGGGCSIGNRTFIGMNVPVKERTVVGDDVIVGTGSAVLRDLNSGVVALGNPARTIRLNNEHRVFQS